MGKQNAWNGQRIRDLDISRKTGIVMVKRKNRALIPDGSLVLLEGDKGFLYTQLHMHHANQIEI